MTVNGKNQSSSNFAERLFEVLGTTEIAEVGRALGISYQQAKNYISGKYLPRAEMLIELANSKNISPTWLLTGRGSKLIDWPIADSFGVPIAPENLIIADLQEIPANIVRREAKKESVPTEDFAATLIIEALQARGLVANRPERFVTLVEEQMIEFFRVPLYGEIAAGHPLKIFEELTQFVDIPAEYKKFGKDLVVFRVRGDSMIDEGIEDADLVICTKVKNQSDVTNGKKVVAVVDDDGATVKKLFRHKNRVTLQPGNPEFEPMIYEASRVNVFACVVGIFRKV
jgi:SOS regulatory protein LexA